jgi:hypothetical protein
VNVGVGIGVVVGGRAEVVRGIEIDSEGVNREFVKVKESDGSFVPDSESVSRLFDTDFVGGRLNVSVCPV